jgi:uncharacterized protein YbaR (Trm112 family)
MPELATPITTASLVYLRCPETLQPLCIADAAVLAKINTAIAAGSMRNRAGTLLQSAIEGGLLREDGAVLYPILDGIPNLIADEGIAREDWERGNQKLLPEEVKI